MDARAQFGTVIVAMVTPFKANGELDLEAAQRVATHLVDTGCDGVLVSGTTGESPTTHSDEKVALIRAVKSAVGDRAKVMAGAGSNHTDHAVRMAAQAQDAGADSLLVVSPYYNRPSQDGVAAHIEAVASAADLPVMVYDIPGRTGVAVGPEASARLAKHANIVAFKDATGNAVAGCRRGRELGMAVYSGDDGLNLSFLAHGGVGMVSVVGHVAADRYRRMVDAMRPDDDGNVNLGEALAIHNEVAPLNDAIMGGGQGAVLAKTAMAELGVIDEAHFRLPIVGATEPQVEALRAALRQLEYARV
ncbi:MAG TPA: 4-hydroxy-tetrahydrodipicolinate synthase [Actinomycetaceae bacterium]|nr:4-hydroxy-tetrahydrodipicolinate synthase [Actinomycetaceae bacterium]